MAHSGEMGGKDSILEIITPGLLNKRNFILKRSSRKGVLFLVEFPAFKT